MSEPYIRLTNVDKIYETKDGPVVAVDDATFDIEDTEFISIVGPSGCGKTTILKMIAGLMPFTSGEITISGQIVDRPQTDWASSFRMPYCWTGAMCSPTSCCRSTSAGSTARKYEPRP